MSSKECHRRFTFASSLLQDRGLSRWDTCGPQAVLDAHGGALVKLSSFVAEGGLEGYCYRRVDSNLDFEPGGCFLSKYNVAPAARSLLPTDRSEPAPLATAVEQVLPFANTRGVLAVPSADPEKLRTYHEAVSRAASTHAPAYD